MFRLRKTFRFEASHQLPNHEGKCKRLHGHSWVGHIVVVGGLLETEGPRAGMLTDYGDLSAILQPLIEERLDHHHLNESTGLKNPTSENLAMWIFGWLQGPISQLRAGGVNLESVTIEETCTCSCEYRP